MDADHVSFDWSSFIADHPLFGDLTAHEIDTLLEPANSKQREFDRRDIVFRAGEISNSFFLIGDGSVDVELASDESSAITICTLYRGDYFGEMSAIDNQGGRAATILANDDCTLLEIKSKPFLQVIKANPELEFKLLSMLAARLRHVNDHLLKNTRLTYDNKFSLLSEKIESQSKVVDASLDASHAVFEQTKIRTSEIIEAAERGRTRITWLLSILTTGFTLIFGVIGFLGYNEFKAAESNKEKVDTIAEEITKKELLINNAVIQAEQAVSRAGESAKYIENAKKGIDELKNVIATVNETLLVLQENIDVSEKAQRILFESLIPIFSNKVDEKIRLGNESEPGALGLHMLELNDAKLTIKLLKKIFSAIGESHQKILANDESDLPRARISFYTSFMYLYIYSVDGRPDDNKLAQFLCSYLLLITYAMDEGYAEDNDFYHDVIDANQYPVDRFSSRLHELRNSDDPDLKNLEQFIQQHNLATELNSELNQINDPEGGFKISGDKIKSINEILGYEPRLRS